MQIQLQIHPTNTVSQFQCSSVRLSHYAIFLSYLEDEKSVPALSL